MLKSIVQWLRGEFDYAERFAAARRALRHSQGAT